MSLFFWRKNKVIDIFASALADELYSAVQPEAATDYLGGGGGEKNADKSRKKIDRRMDDMVLKIQQFRVTNSLGVYGKARLHLRFSERLKELGYEAKVADRFNQMLLVRTP